MQQLEHSVVCACTEMYWHVVINCTQLATAHNVLWQCVALEKEMEEEHWKRPDGQWTGAMQVHVHSPLGVCMPDGIALKIITI